MFIRKDILKILLYLLFEKNKPITKFIYGKFVTISDKRSDIFLRYPKNVFSLKVLLRTSAGRLPLGLLERCFFSWILKPGSLVYSYFHPNKAMLEKSQKVIDFVIREIEEDFFPFSPGQIFCAQNDIWEEADMFLSPNPLPRQPLIKKGELVTILKSNWAVKNDFLELTILNNQQKFVTKKTKNQWKSLLGYFALETESKNPKNPEKKQGYFEPDFDFDHEIENPPQDESFPIL